MAFPEDLTPFLDLDGFAVQASAITQSKQEQLQFVQHMLRQLALQLGRISRRKGLGTILELCHLT